MNFYPKFLLLIGILLTTQGLFAQQTHLNYCGTDNLPPHMLNWLKKHQAALHQQPTGNVLKASDEAPIYVPVVFHVVGKDNNTGFFPDSDVFNLLCEVNERYTGVGMQFYNAAPFNYISNSSYYAHDFGTGYYMMANNNFPNVINIYVVDDPAGNCGYFSPSGDALAVAHSCSGNNSTTLAHELGHYFSLPHTFLGWEGGDTPQQSLIELADGSNCSSAGDFFCDTPADYVSDRWQCPYSGSLEDPTGAPVVPDGSYYMSYSNDACQSQFSEEQKIAMIDYLHQMRNDLLGAPQPDLPLQDIGEMQMIYPASGNDDVPANNAQIVWTAATGADSYYITLKNLTNNEITRTYVSDTFYQVQSPLLVGGQYVFTIQPVSQYNVCSASIYRQFTASEQVFAIEQLTVTPPPCFGDETASLSFAATGGSNSGITYAWSNGVTGNTLTDIGSGNVTVSVSDDAGNTGTFEIIVPQPDELYAIVNQTVGNSLTANAIGGTAPYSFTWSDGSTGSELALSASGTYELTVTDANNCVSTKTYDALYVNADIFQLACQAGSTGSIILEDNDAYEYAWSNGYSGNFVSNLSAGEYTVTVTDTNTDETAEFTYELVQPEPITATVSVSGSSAFASVDSGTPPFSFIWPNGFSTIPTALNLSNGSYTLQIFDANNCSTNVPFNITDGATGIEVIDTENALQWSVAPTAMPIGTPIQLTASQQTVTNSQWQFNLFDVTGSRVWSTLVQAQSKVQIAIPTANLSSNMYLLQWQTEKGTSTQKILLY